MSIEQLGGRKFVLCVIFALIFGVMAVTGQITTEELKEGLLWLVGIFSGANALQKLGGKNE